jgi:DUF3040 family protein
MSMLNDRDRHLLNDLQQQLEHEDPEWVRQFKDPKPPRRARRDLLLETSIGLTLLLAAFGLLLSIPGVVVVCGCAAVVLARIGYRRRASGGT